MLNRTPYQLMKMAAEWESKASKATSREWRESCERAADRCKQAAVSSYPKVKGFHEPRTQDRP